MSAVHFDRPGETYWVYLCSYSHCFQFNSNTWLGVFLLFPITHARLHGVCYFLAQFLPALNFSWRCLPVETSFSYLSFYCPLCSCGIPVASLKAIWLQWPWVFWPPPLACWVLRLQMCNFCNHFHLLNGWLVHLISLLPQDLSVYRVEDRPFRVTKCTNPHQRSPCQEFSTSLVDHWHVPRLCQEVRLL